MLVDDLGKTLYNVTFNGSVEIMTSDYLSGVYFIVVDDKETFKVIKK